jgi:hypothetical protein
MLLPSREGEMGSRAWGRGSAVVVLVVALLATACGGGTSGQRADGFEVATIARSTEAAKSARYEGSIRSPFPSDTDGIDVEFTGEVDFERGRSTWNSRQRQADGRWDDLDSITIGDDVYSETVDLPDTMPDDPEHSQPTKSWTHWSRAGFGRSRPDETDVLDVSGLLGKLADESNREEVGAETVRGVETTHYRFTTEGIELPAQLVATGTSSTSGGTVDVWVDGEQRLRRYESASTDGKDARHIEWFDFGAPVTIEPPAADQVMEDPYPMAEVTEDWALVQNGRSGAVSWRIFRAPATDDQECLSVETDPPGPFPDGFAVQRGKPLATCTQRPPNGTDDDHPIDEVTSQVEVLHDGRALLFGETAPHVTDLVLHHRDGRTERVKPVDRTFAIALAADDVVNRIDPVAPETDIRCDLDRSFGGFNCSGSFGPQGPPGSMPPDWPDDVPPPPGDLPADPTTPTGRVPTAPTEAVPGA